MAKHKGKSGRRIKDWKQRFDTGEPLDEAMHRQSFARREVKLPPHRLEAPQENLEGLPKANGMIVGLFPGGAFIRTDKGELQCSIAKTFRPPENSSALAVGDEATVAITRPQHADGATETDKDRADGMIISREPRRTALSRPQPTSGKHRGNYDAEMIEKVIVANMDDLMIVTAVRQPPLRHGLIDRYLIAAERGELKPVLVINKIDLAMSDEDEKVLADFQSLGTKIIMCSALTGDGLDELRSEFTGKRSILAGASGVGKTTIINALLPSADGATRTVRPKDNRGRHTTTSAVVYELDCGGMLVDTPGIRELGVHMDAAELTWYFPEFEQYGANCKFNDCTHTHEPDCAVIKAVESGDILPRRYESYLRILDTLKD